MDVTSGYQREVAHLREAGVAGASGRLRDLFDWLAARGPGAPSASQDTIAREVFGQDGADADDATVRVYMHRLRRRIEDHYASHGPAAGGVALEIPSGVYALVPAAPEESGVAGKSILPQRHWWWALAGATVSAALLALLFAFNRPPAANALWQPLIASDRPVLVVVGDYYMFGEYDAINPENGRLIRDFRIDGPADLYALQEAEPDRYANAEDVGLNYLPYSSADGLMAVLPLLARAGEQVTVIAASDLEPGMLSQADVVYIGLLSGMGVLEESAFIGSGFSIGESYDELTDNISGRSYVSSEARSLSTPSIYQDHAYLARFEAPTGAQVVILAGQRETALRGISQIAVADALDPAIAEAAGSEGVEALVEVAGQQGADLSSRVLVARARR